MEEADVLSDRIAIMDHGVVQCHGTPMYLKAKLGAGYSLAVVLTPKSKLMWLKSRNFKNLRLHFILCKLF